MTNKNNIQEQISKAVAAAKAKKRLVILEMPEELETAPHWLLWLAVVSLVGLLIAVSYQAVSTSNSLQAYLPFL